MADTLGIIMHGATGRMGTNQHLVRSILAIRAAGGVALSDGRRVVPDPLLVGRDASKLSALAAAHGIDDWTTDLDAALSDARPVFFDSALTVSRAGLLGRAVAAGKHIYCEKPVAVGAADALALAREARAAGVRHGVVQDKLWLPGIRKLKLLIDSGFFGRILSVRGEFGYWVFPGDRQPAQRPSWNYREEDGGGIVLDMLPHWDYLLDGLFGRVSAVSCRTAIHLPRRWDEAGRPYESTAADAAYATFELEGGILAHFNSSWCVRVRRDDLLTIQVDGTDGSAVAGCATAARRRRSTRRARCGIPTCRPRSTTPRAGRRCPTSRCTTTRSRRSGRRSSATCARTPPSRGTCSPARAACGLPRRRWRAPPMPAGRPCRRSRNEMPTLTLPTAKGALAPYTLGEPRALPRRANRPFNRVAFAAAHVVADARADNDPGSRRRSTGSARWRSAGGCGTSASASPKRWTPRSAAPGWTGRRAAS